MATSPALGLLREARLRQGTIRYYETGRGEPLLFVHGLLANADVWRHVIPTLAEGYRCIAPDWPLGAHYPAMAPHADLTPSGIAKLVLAFMDELRLGQVTLVGNDLGGSVCQIVAAMAPERIERLVLTNCDAFDNMPPRAMKPVSLLARVPGGATLLGYLLQIPLMQRAVLRLVQQRRPDPTVMAATFRPLRFDRGVRRDFAKILGSLSPSYTREAAAKLGKLASPALVVWGEDDLFLPAQHADQLAAALGSARVVKVAESRTFLPEDQPAVLAGAIQEFLQESATT